MAGASRPPIIVRLISRLAERAAAAATAPCAGAAGAAAFWTGAALGAAAGALLDAAGAALGAELPGAGGATPIIVCLSAERAAERALPRPGRGAAAAGGAVSGFGATDLLSAAPAGTLRVAGAGWLAFALPGVVPSTMIAAPQRLHVMRTLRPRTFSSG